jgi:hypothetical protein
MSKAISYSLFGYNKITPQNSFEFETYLRGLFVNIRINRVLYPGWVNVVNMDRASYNSPYKQIFDWLTSETTTQIVLQEEAPLCKAMLWRFKTVFAYDHPNWKYSHIICRDTDSISTYREAQAVTQWIQEDRTAHCITDSVSHNIPMMGGMCGFRPGYLNERLKLNEAPETIFDTLMKMSGEIDYARKGADQDFLMKYIYPKVAVDSVTAHFCLGMRQVSTEDNGMHYSIPDIDIGIDPAQKFLNTCAGHIGASGYYEPPMLKWLNTMDPHKEYYAPIQKQFPKIFFWA